MSGSARTGGTRPTCALCGARTRPPFRTPQPEIAPDLDMRPGEPARSTLPNWLQTCAGCAAVAPDLGVLPAEAKPIVESAEYRALAETVPAEAIPFRRWSLIRRGLQDPVGEAEALLQAAWACDDAQAGAEANALRAAVAQAWESASGTAALLRRLDVLRRSGDWVRAEHLVQTLNEQSLDATAASVVAFQRARLAARDAGRHLMSSALPPPAHAPHVSHRRHAPVGFWGRLFRKGT